MRGKVTAIILATVLAAGLAVWETKIRNDAPTFQECKSATVEMMPLPIGCDVTAETPPENLIRIVQRQQQYYHLVIQKLVVCRSAHRFPQIEPDFTETAFSREVRDRWLPLYIGCCSYQFGRHVTVVASDSSEKGAVVVEAALIEGCWDFRLNWSKAKPND